MPALSTTRVAGLESLVSTKFSIRNARSRPLQNASLTWLDYDRHPLWGDPIDFSKSISLGEVSTVDVSSRRIRIVEFKLKFFIGGRRVLIEIGHPPDLEGLWFYWTEIEVVVDDIGYFLSKQSWSKVEFDDASN